MPHDFRKRPRDGREFSGPVGQLVRPAEPGGFVAFPFGGHAETESVGRFGLWQCLHWEKEFNTEIAEDTEITEKKRPDRLSKGILFFVQPAVQDGLISVDAAVAEKRPIAAGVLALGGIAFDDEDFFFVVGSFGDHLAEGISNKGIAPEFQSRVTFFLLAFSSDAVHDRCVHAVCDGMPALDGAPRVELRGAELRFFVRMPAAAGGIKNTLSAAERGDPRALRIPLVPANRSEEHTSALQS